MNQDAENEAPQLNERSGEPSGASNTSAATTGSAPPPPGRAAILKRQPWLVFVLPFLVYMLANTWEPGPDSSAEDTWLGFSVPYRFYPAVYTLKLALTLVAVWFVWPGYAQFRWRVSPLAPLVGALGILVWLGFTSLALEGQVLGAVGLEGLVDLGARSAYNPLDQMSDRPALAWGFLAVRFLGLVCVVPLIEELFLRGFVMRFVAAAEWWKLPFGAPHVLGIAVSTAVAVSLHPAELLAELCWFSLVTWLMVRTRNIWDCVVAHGVTNLLLGLYVVGCDLAGFANQWHLM